MPVLTDILGIYDNLKELIKESAKAESVSEQLKRLYERKIY